MKNLPAMQEMQETWVRMLSPENPLEEGMATDSSILAQRTHGQRSLMGYSPWGRRASDTTKETELACRHGNELIDSPLCSSSINTLAAGRVPRAPGFVTRAGPPCWLQLWAGPAGGRTFSPCSPFNLLARAARLQGAGLGWAGGGGGPDQPERRSPLQLAGHQNPRKLLPCGASPPPVSFTSD